MNNPVGRKLPPIFRSGPSQVTQLLGYMALGLCLLVADARYGYLSILRQGFALVTYPLQVAVSKPAHFVVNMQEYIGALSNVQRENQVLRQAQLKSAERLLRQDVLEEENQSLRALLNMSERVGSRSVAADVLFSSRDPFSRRVVIDKGGLDQIERGEVVVDGAGVVGQVVRVDPLQAEVSLITDPGISVPVHSLRNGVRAVTFGAGEGRLELRYVTLESDVKVGDRFVSSGLDGVFLPGLPVAEVLEVRRGEQAFAVILAKPVSAVDAVRHTLVLAKAKSTSQTNPYEPSDETGSKKGAAQKDKKEGATSIRPKLARPPTPRSKNTEQ